MDIITIALLVVGAALLGGAIYVYLRDTSRYVFPIVLALIGAFLMAAEQVSATFPGGGGISLARDVAEKSSEAADQLLEASQQNSEAIAGLNAALTDYQSAFKTYQEDVNQRFADLDEEPVPMPTLDIEQSRLQVQSSIEAARSANDEAQVQSNALRDLADRVRIGT
ncbi:MAG: hypothetical protein ACX930_09615 [Erythrobacter sp.]